MNDHATLRQFASAVEPLQRAVQFRAWVVQPKSEGNPRNEAYPAKLPDWIETSEQAAQCLCSCLSHKASILVLRADASLRPEQRNLLTVFLVRKRSRRRWVRGPEGKAVQEPAEYPDFVMEVCVRDGFEPVRPWRIEDGNPAGHDLQLVEQG